MRAPGCIGSAGAAPRTGSSGSGSRRSAGRGEACLTGGALGDGAGIAAGGEDSADTPETSSGTEVGATAALDGTAGRVRGGTGAGRRSHQKTPAARASAATTAAVHAIHILEGFATAVRRRGAAGAGA